MSDPFEWRQYEGEIIVTCVQWCLRYVLSYRDLEEMMTKCGLSVDHSTIFRWVQRYAPQLDQRCHPSLKQSTDSWLVDERPMSRSEANGCSCVGQSSLQARPSISS